VTRHATPFDPVGLTAGGQTEESAVARLFSNPHAQLQVEDGYLIALAKQGNKDAYDRLVRRYYGFVRLKASSYFLAGGDSDDLIQEGLVGLYKAIRDFRSDRESSFRNFAELCITRQIITAVKTATRNKHSLLNQYVSFSSTPAGASESEPSLDEIIPGSPVHDPVNQVISSEELRALVACISTALSELESRVLALYLDGHSYEEVGQRLGCDCKTVDNALQRVKRKVGQHLAGRAVPA
jgi:RNA polymerase sporulation-specific sigma factor